MTTKTDRDIYRELSAEFSEAAHGTLNKSGRNLTYIPVSEVIARLNTVLGVDGWSFHVLSVGRDAADPDWVIARGRIEALINDRLIVRDGVGGIAIKRNRSGEIVDLGDEFKGAVSDALKKAAQQLGVGLYLARDEDILAEEGFYNAPEEQPAVDPDVQAKWHEFRALTQTFDDDQKAAIKDFWASKTTDKLALSSMTGSRIDVLLDEAKRLSVGGSFEDAA